ncbi:MAG: NAD(P)H-dependent oxidoreductase [Comamonas sp.]|jgi:NAD(P)H-dependent FMN reductase|nr:NAD(P)H-dependent oxidoreductase [Comamonas sp.]
MQLLAISGSARAASTNTALLRALGHIAPAGLAIEVFQDLAALPVFSPDLEGALTPAPVLAFVQQVQAADGLLISSPEYVRALPGGLKNAIDWLVSREEIIQKPVALVHASHRGDDMLADLRRVLSTVTAQFNGDLFLRVPLMKESTASVLQIVSGAEVYPEAQQFLQDFAAFCRRTRTA